MAKMTSSEDAAPQRSWWMARVFALIIVPLIGAYSLLEPFGRDQGIHATIAYALDNGLVTYRDVFNIKPPLTTAVHWLSQVLFGHSMMAIRELDLIFATLTGLGLVEIGRLLRRGLAFGFAAPVGFALIYYSYGFWAHAQTDGWAAFLVVAALWMMLLGWRRSKGRVRLWLMIGSGVALGLAFGLKYTIGGAGVLIFAPLIAGLIGQTHTRFLLRDLLACVLGGLAVLALIIAVMVAFGALDPFLEIQSFIVGYVGYVPKNKPGLLYEFLLIGMSSPYLIAAVAVGLIAAALEWAATRRSLSLVVALLWVLAGWVSGHVQGKGASYHFLPMLPAYALLFGIAIEAIAGLLRKPAHSRAFVMLALIALYLPSHAAKLDKYGLIAFGQPDPAKVFIAATPSSSDFDLAAIVAFADVVKAHRKPGDTLFLWGYSTMLYFLADEPPRYRYPYSWPFMVNYYDGRYTQDLLNRLRANPPTQFVLQSKDATPWVTQNPKSSDEMLAEYPALTEFLAQNYHLVAKQARFALYERND
jgi:hypothetical protein